MPIPTRLTPQTKNCPSSIPSESTQCIWRTGHFLDLSLESVATDQSLEKRSYWPIKPNLLRPAQQYNKQQNTCVNAVKAIVPMSTQNYSVCRPRHCFTLYIAIKRTVPMSTPKLLRVWPRHCFTLYVATKRTGPMSTQKLLLYRPQHCFTLYIATKRTVSMSTQKLLRVWPRHCFTSDIAIKTTVYAVNPKPAPCIDHHTVSHLTQLSIEPYCQSQTTPCIDHDTVSHFT